MSVKFIVDDYIDMRQMAAQRSNMRGPWQEKKRHDWDRFTGIALDTTNRWATNTTDTTGPATIAISEVQGGSVLITTGTADNDSCSMSSALIWSAAKLAIVEFRITITDVSGTGLFVGFSDAKDEANGSIAIHYLDDALTTVASNAVGFVIDADHATSSIMCASVKADVDTTAVDLAVDWADGETKVLRIALDVDGNAWFYLAAGDVINEKRGYIGSAVTAATLLCATAQALTRANDGANTVRVHSYDAWQDD